MSTRHAQGTARNHQLQRRAADPEVAAAPTRAPAPMRLVGATPYGPIAGTPAVQLHGGEQGPDEARTAGPAAQQGRPFDTGERTVGRLTYRCAGVIGGPSLFRLADLQLEVSGTTLAYRYAAEGGQEIEVSHEDYGSFVLDPEAGSARVTVNVVPLMPFLAELASSDHHEVRADFGATLGGGQVVSEPSFELSVRVHGELGSLAEGEAGASLSCRDETDELGTRTECRGEAHVEASVLGRTIVDEQVESVGVGRDQPDRGTGSLAAYWAYQALVGEGWGEAEAASPPAHFVCTPAAAEWGMDRAEELNGTMRDRVGVAMAHYEQIYGRRPHRTDWALVRANQQGRQLRLVGNMAATIHRARTTPWPNQDTAERAAAEARRAAADD